MNRTDEEGDSPAHVAAFGGHAACLQLVIDAGGDLGSRNLRGRTAAHLAAGWGHAQCLRHLLHRGADAGKVSLGGKTPLHDASGWGHDECLRLLLDAGASHETVDKGGWTPLMAAARNGHLQCLSLLLHAGSDFSTSNNYDTSPLLAASREDHASCVALLLEAGADPQAENQFGETPLGVAPEGSLSRSILADELQRRKFETWNAFSHSCFPPGQRAHVRSLLLQGIRGRFLREQPWEDPDGLYEFAIPPVCFRDALKLLSRDWFSNLSFAEVLCIPRMHCRTKWCFPPGLIHSWCFHSSTAFSHWGSWTVKVLEAAVLGFLICSALIYLS